MQVTASRSWQLGGVLWLYYSLTDYGAAPHMWVPPWGMCGVDWVIRAHPGAKPSTFSVSFGWN